MSSNAPKNLSAKNPETKKYYFLVAGNVFFAPQGKGPEEIGTLSTNAIISTDNGQLRASELGDAQRALAQAMQDRIGAENPVDLVDVQVLNICKLGHMLPSEFFNLQPAPAPAEQTMEDVAPAKVV